MSILIDHHIIPKQFENHRAFRGIDRQKLGVHVPGNRIYLPADHGLAKRMGISPHPGGHMPEYYESVDRVLNQIEQIADPEIRAAEIEALIDAMRIGFTKGDLYTNVPIGKTREEVISAIKRVVENYRTYREGNPAQLQASRNLSREGSETGQSHLIQWSAILRNALREKQLSEAITENPSVNITSRNRNLGGTGWESNFTAADDIFRLPPSAPINPGDVPSLPAFAPPSLADLSKTEGLTRIDPRLANGLPGFPVLSPNEQQLSQLPPTTATPSDPLVLRYDPATGAPLPFYENSLIGYPSANGSSLAQDLLPWLAGGAALGIAAPFIPAWLLLLGAGVAAGTSVARAQDIRADATGGAATTGGGVFSTGAPAYNTFVDARVAGSTTNGGYPASSTFGAPLTASASLDQDAAHGSTFADRFGNWTNTPAGTMPAQPSNTQEAPAAPAAGTLAPEEIRRLTRVSASNAGSVFVSGSVPVPYLPSTEFNDRFGNWTMPIADGRPSQMSKPIGMFGDEPSYLIPPPIFGVDGPGNPRNDAEEWFSRWIRPFLRPE
ncbi:hypothetical protein GWG65_20340 [Bradyrhizobium sp. CSA207]|uniref:AHH domain-containing protein n=1 Tax=Bradyrhizobium sp. CSA207 TaxID=2698826 RepID=UPI0023AF5FA5|nr:AHH domain-containing protein [Bradyrhizobium sp. CSA207]MDE5443755.1 hypothetical protein [Bradyrhizobium sp. CSA207]